MNAVAVTSMAVMVWALATVWHYGPSNLAAVPKQVAPGLGAT